MSEKNLNRRDFLISAGRKIAVGGLGLIGLSLGYKSLTSESDKYCEVNLPCRNCFKLGDCNENKAVNTREKINTANSVKAGEIKNG